jgi:hypothetical protein
MVTRDDGTFMEFGPTEAGLYYSDFTSSIKRKQKSKTMVIQAVEENKRNYTRIESEGVDCEDISISA